VKALYYLIIILIAGCTLIIGSDGATVTTETGVDEIFPVK